MGEGNPIFTSSSVAGDEASSETRRSSAATFLRGITVVTKLFTGCRLATIRRVCIDTITAAQLGNTAELGERGPDNFRAMYFIVKVTRARRH